MKKYVISNDGVLYLKASIYQAFYEIRKCEVNSAGQMNLIVTWHFQEKK